LESTDIIELKIIRVVVAAVVAVVKKHDGKLLEQTTETFVTNSVHSSGTNV